MARGGDPDVFLEVVPDALLNWHAQRLFDILNP